MTLRAEKFQEVNFTAEAAGEVRVLEEPRGERERCRCLQTCSYLAYEPTTSSAETKAAHWLSRFDREQCQDESYREKTTVESSVTIYFKETYFIPNRRLERFGVIDFLANCGGLFGLCLGVSALSVVEVLCWLLVRPWYHTRGQRRENDVQPQISYLNSHQS
ncbi:hypothetical protein R5R35_001588 [Gryllus longicercus]|uniref:Pickpocket n=1 Tax=Gryllus longicercus TaxID=2509291 RepID=A0AAN9VZK0_9ORTH